MSDDYVGMAPCTRAEWEAREDEATETISGLTDELTRLREENERRKKLHDQDDALIARLREALKVKDADIGGLERDLWDAQARLAEGREKFAKLREENRILRDEIADLTGDGFPHALKETVPEPDLPDPMQEGP